MKNKLPKLPSSLVAVARRDLMAVHRLRKTYRIDMGLWHSPTPTLVFEGGPVCSVCQAGAVIARSLKVAPDVPVMPFDFEPVTRNALLALDLLRRGRVHNFVVRLAFGDEPSRVKRFYSTYYQKHGAFAYIDVPGYLPYEADPKSYFKWLKRVEKHLRKLGI